MTGWLAEERKWVLKLRDEDMISQLWGVDA